MSKRIPLEGKVFGSLTVLEKIGVQNTHALYLVECSCGNKIKVIYPNLVSGNSEKCRACYKESLRKLTDEDVNIMTRMKEEGYSYEAIGDHFGVSKSTAYRNINKKKRGSLT